MDKHTGTRFGFSLHLRQRLLERAFENTLEEYGSAPRHQTELLNFEVDNSKDYAITARLRDVATGETHEVQS